MSLSNPSKEYQIIRFESENIILQNKNNRKFYQYFDLKSNVDPLHELTHPTLLRPVFYNNGLLYLKGASNLENQMQNRRRAHEIVYFDEEEILNTFLPLFDSLAFLHSKDIIHGCLSASNVIITQEGDIKVKDWLAQDKENINYFGKKRQEITKDDDIIALGQIILQASTLKKINKTSFVEKDLHPILETLIGKYSKGFIFAVIILLKKTKSKFSSIRQYFMNDDKIVNDLELNNLYEGALKEKEKRLLPKSATNENQVPNPNSIKPTIISIGDSPTKKITLNPMSNLPHKKGINSLGNRQDNQNKRVHHQEIKKKQIQKINKIIERSNEFVNELMSRKNNVNDTALKKIAPKANISLYSYMDTPKKYINNSPILASPAKKIRTISRKK